MRRAEFITCALGTGLLLVACTTSSTGMPERVEPSAGDVPFASSSPAPDQKAAETTEKTASRYGPAPLRAYNLSDEDRSIITQATDQLVAACMRERGFDYEPASVSTTLGGGSEDWADWAGYLGLTDIERARAEGYWVSTQLSAEETEILEQREDALESTLSAEDSAYQAALFGEDFPDAVDSDACDPRSNGSLIPAGEPPNLDVLSEIAEQAEAQAAADTEVIAALEDWRACMTERGYELQHIPFPSGDAERTQEVIDQAVADVECKDSTGLTDTYVTTLYAAQETLIESRQPDLQAYQAYVEERLRLAAEVLADAQ